MKGRLNEEVTDASEFEWLKLYKDERVVLAYITPKLLANPLADDRLCSEVAVLTNLRLVVFCDAAGTPMVTTFPLGRIDAIQTYKSDWRNFWNVLLCIPLFIFYVIPGVIFVVMMNKHARHFGVDIFAGRMRADLRFDRAAPGMLRRFVHALEVSVGAKR